MISQFADLVGMTMASEAVVAQELDIPYASLCSVDNYAHGLMKTPLEMEEVSRRAQRSAESVLRILNRYVERDRR